MSDNPASPGLFAARTPLVGRSDELDALINQFETVATGETGRLILIGGDPGVGKTRLAEEVTAHAQTRGHPVLWGRCYEGEGSPAFWPWTQALRALIADQPPDARRSLIEGRAADLAQILPELRRDLPDLPEKPSLPPAEARFRLFESVATLLMNAARRHPILLVLDDLHWADKPSLLLLHFLAGELNRLRLLVVGTYRDQELDRQHPLRHTLGDLARVRFCDRLALRGLSERDVARFIDLTTGRAPAPDLTAAILQKTDGNPFYLTEVVRLLVAEAGAGPLPSQPNALTIPTSVRQAVGRRLDQLSPDTNRLLAIAAVAGREFSLSLLAQVSGRAIEAVLQALDEAVAARIVAEVPTARGRYLFAHDLVRDTLYLELARPLRADLHRAIGDALERLPANDPDQRLTELAHHYLEAAVIGDRAKAVDYARRAGDNALGKLACEEAGRLYQSALHTIDLDDRPDDGRRCALWLALGDAWRRAGELDQALSAFRTAAAIARRLGLPDELARAAIGYEDTFLVTGRPRSDPECASVDLLGQARSALAGAPNTLHVRVLAALARALYFAGVRDEAPAVSHEALDLARRLDDPRALIAALSAHRLTMWGPGNLAERLAVATELRRQAEAIQDYDAAQEGSQWRLRAVLERGDPAAAAAEIATYRRIAEASRQPQYLSFATTWEARQALLQGRFDDAERLAREAYAIGQRTRSLNAEFNFTTQIFHLRREQGRLKDEPEFERIINGWLITVARSNLSEVAVCHASLALLHSELGRTDEARAEFEILAGNNFADLALDYFYLPTLTWLTPVCVFLNDVEHAAALYECQAPFADRVVVGIPVCPGPVALNLGVLAAGLGAWEKAAAHFERAIASSRRLGARPSLARAQAEYAAMLRRSAPAGGRDRARALLEPALQTATELGMAGLVERLRALKTDLDAPSPAGEPRPPNLPDGLTAREVEVLRRIAAGRTTKQIAADLVISVPTAERHTSNIYAKIDAHGRADAIRYALRHGLAELDR